MADMRTLQKVTAFITRPGANGPDLLLFGHPVAGIQLPAGTVEWNETVEAGLLREVREETGLTRVRVITPLAVLNRTLPGHQRLILRLTKVFDEPASDASSAGHALRRGVTVRLDGQVGQFSAVTYEELAEGHDRPQVLKRFSGYVRTSLLTDRLERHCFHLISDQETSDTWPVVTDNHTFQLFWVPLAPRPEIHPLQAAWLDAVYPDLLASAQAHH